MQDEIVSRLANTLNAQYARRVRYGEGLVTGERVEHDLQRSWRWMSLVEPHCSGVSGGLFASPSSRPLAGWEAQNAELH